MTFQLRRIGLPPSVEKVKNLYRLSCETTMIGRGQTVDIFLDSNIRKGLISRAHAQIIKKEKNGQEYYELFDTSLNGTYINDIKIKGSQHINVGDVIAFGHLRGSLIEPGAYAPQKESEFFFKFELSEHPDIKEEYFEVDLIGEKSKIRSKSTVFLSPSSPTNNNTHEYADSRVALPGVLEEKGELPINGLAKALKRKRLDDDTELKELIQSVTNKVKNGDVLGSQDISFNLTEEQYALSHPRDKFLQKSNQSPASNYSTENDIKIDTSINVKHVSPVKQNGRVKVQERVGEILNDHELDTKIKYEEENNIEENNIINKPSTRNKGDARTNLLDDARNYERGYEGYFSENSEEITDDSRDSDFSVSDYKSPKKVKRNTKAPEKFSPSENQSKHLKNKMNDVLTKNKVGQRKQPTEVHVSPLKKKNKNNEKEHKSKYMNSSETKTLSKNKQPDKTIDDYYTNDGNEKTYSSNSHRTRKVSETSTSLRKKKVSKYTDDLYDEEEFEDPVPTKTAEQIEYDYEHDKCDSVDCIRPANGVKKITWVQCDDCDKWYHVTCSGLSEKEARSSKTVFHCGC